MKTKISWVAAIATCALAIPTAAHAASPADAGTGGSGSAAVSATEAAAAYDEAAPMAEPTNRPDVTVGAQGAGSTPASVVLDPSAASAPIVVTPESSVASGSRQVVGDLSIFDGETGSTVVEETSDGVRLASVLDTDDSDVGKRPDVAVSYDFDGAKLEWAHNVPNPPSESGELLPQDGSVLVRDSEGSIVARVAAPWATDSAGVDLPTHYVIDGSTLTQVIDTEDATGTVVADPYLDFNWTNVKIMLTRRERDYIWKKKYYGAGAATIAALACDATGVWKYPCKVAIIASSAYAFSNLDASQRSADCFYIRLSYVPNIPPLLGHTRDNCRY